jgi:hypothetical protein
MYVELFFSNISNGVFGLGGGGGGGGAGGGGAGAGGLSEMLDALATDC